MPHSTSPIKCIVFDLGGVLVRICRSWQEACFRAGLAFHGQIASPEIVQRRMALVHQYETGRITCVEFFAAAVATTTGWQSVDEFRRAHRAMIIGEYDGVRDLIDSIHARGLATGVLSNTNHAHWHDLRQGIAARVHHPHASHLLGVAKPHADIYRAFELASRFAPHQILFFDDLADNIEGARAAGWHAELVDHTGDPASQMSAALRARCLL